MVQSGAVGAATWWFLLAGVAAAASITTLETALVLAGLCWIARLLAGPRRPVRPDLVLTCLLGALAGWSLLSALAAPRFRVSMGATASSLMWGVAPMATAVLTPRRRQTVRALLLLQAGLLGGWAALEWGLWWDGDPLWRVRGPFSHHMTLAGVLLVATVQGLPRPHLEPLVSGAAGRWLGRLAVLAGVAGLAATITRSALLGLAVGVATIWILRPRSGGRGRLAVTMAAALLLGGALAAPALLEIRRGGAILSAGAASVEERLVLWGVGLAMVGERPLLGIGAHATRHEAARFLPPDHPRPGRPAHLHSAPLTLAAERGLPALGLAVWLYAATFRRFRCLRSGPGADGRRGAAGAVAAFLVMGLFENNFDDSEVLFLHLLTLSAAWTGGAGDADRDGACPGPPGAVRRLPPRRPAGPRCAADAAVC